MMQWVFLLLVLWVVTRNRYTPGRVRLRVRDLTYNFFTYPQEIYLPMTLGTVIHIEGG